MEKEKNNLSEFDEYIISPVIDEEPDSKQTIIGISIGVAYLFILSSFVYLIMAIFNKNLMDVNYDSTLYEVIAQLIAGVIVIIGTLFILKNEKIVKILKGFNLKNLGRAATFMGMAYVALIFVSYIEVAFFGTNDVSTSNQDSLVVIMQQYKLLSFFFIVVTAPIVEEIIFRYFIFRGLQKKLGTIWVFVLTVASFVAVHYISSISAGTLLEDLKSILEYVVPAFILTFLYYKNKNLATPIMFHMAFNGLQWLLLVFSSSTGGNTSTGISGVVQAITSLLGA